MEVLLTVPLGVAAQVLLFLVLRRAAGMAAGQAALIVALLALALYVPYAIVRWPGADVVALHVAIYLVTAYALGLIAGHRQAAAGATGFHWAPTLIVAFFVMLVLFNAVLVVVATRGLPEPVARVLFPHFGEERHVSSAFPGVVGNDLQKKEALYNAYLEQVERQRARGWQVRKGWLEPARAGQPAVFQVQVADRAGAALTGAQVTGRFLRPADTRLDQEARLTEVSPGVYQSILVLPAPGNWDLALDIRLGEERHELRASTTVAP